MNIRLRHHIIVARQLTRVMDLRFSILGIRFGIDPLLDVIPGFGNIAAAVTSGYLLWIARELRVPASVIRTMLWNIAADYLFGVVPVVGVVFDVFYKANVRNMALLEPFIDSGVLEGEIVDA